MFRKNIWGIILGGILIIEGDCQTTLAAARVEDAAHTTRGDSLTPIGTSNKTLGTDKLFTAQPAAVNTSIGPLQKEESRMEDSTQQTQQNATTTLLKAMANIVVGNDDTKTLFPQQKEDLESINDVGRAQFISLSNWFLNVITQNLADSLKSKILELDTTFIALVNTEWSTGIYESCETAIGTAPDSNEIPASALDGCSVDSILNITPDFFPSNADTGFVKLVSIVKLAESYVKVEARSCVEELKTRIRSAVQKYKPETIGKNLADHNNQDIQSSVDHFRSWIELAMGL